MRHHPDHLRGVVARLPIENDIFPFAGDDHTPSFQIRCSCGHEEFEVWRSGAPSVFALCPGCRAALIVYDLRLYPAATYIERPDPFTLVTLPCRCHNLELYAAYEYPDPEPDVPFHQNDISWCYVRCRCRLHQTVEEIVNDETT